MIVLPCISQVVYEIGENRYTCYTNEENRIIAKILLTEEFLNSKLNIVESENTILEDYNIDLTLRLNDCVNLLDNTIEHNDELSILYKELHEDYISTIKERDRYRRISYITGGSSIGLILLITTIIIIN